MDNKKQLIDLVCKGYCKFYKESKNEELACEGFRFFERLLSSPVNTPDKKPPHLFLRELNRSEWALVSAGNRCGGEYDSILMNILCKKCDFLVDGCDYRDEKYHSEATPCGGFILLNKILEEQKNISHRFTQTNTDKKDILRRF